MAASGKPRSPPCRSRQVGHDAVLFLGTAPRDAKAGDDLVEDEDDAEAARDFTDGFEEARLGSSTRCNGSAITAASSCAWRSIIATASAVC
jgi:hypothetical protein